MEEEEDSLVEEEVEAVFQEEEVDSLAEEDNSLNQEIHTKETD